MKIFLSQLDVLLRPVSLSLSLSLAIVLKVQASTLGSAFLSWPDGGKRPEKSTTYCGATRTYPANLANLRVGVFFFSNSPDQSRDGLVIVRQDNRYGAAREAAACLERDADGGGSGSGGDGSVDR